MRKDIKVLSLVLLLLVMVGSVFAIDLPDGFDSSSEFKSFVGSFNGTPQELSNELNYACENAVSPHRNSSSKYIFHKDYDFGVGYTELYNIQCSKVTRINPSKIQISVLWQVLDLNLTSGKHSRSFYSWSQTPGWAFPLPFSCQDKPNTTLFVELETKEEPPFEEGDKITFKTKVKNIGNYNAYGIIITPKDIPNDWEINKEQFFIGKLNPNQTMSRTFFVTKGQTDSEIYVSAKACNSNEVISEKIPIPISYWIIGLIIIAGIVLTIIFNKKR